MIETKEVYLFKGKTYNNLKEVKVVIENVLGKIIDLITNDGNFTPKHKILLFNLIIMNKSNLRNALTDLIDYAAAYKEKENG